MEIFSPFWSRNQTPNGPIPSLGFIDSDDPRVLSAAIEISTRKIARPYLIGPSSHQSIPTAFQLPSLTEDEKKLALSLLQEKQKKNNFSIDHTEKQWADPLYQGIALLLLKKIDGLIGGSLRPTAEIVKAAIQCIGPKEGIHLISGHFLIETDARKTWDNTPFLFADCAVMPEPSSRALAGIAMAAAASYQFFTKKEPKVALLSFSTRDSAVHPLVDRIKEAVSILRKQAPELKVDGEIQLDAVLNTDIAHIKKATDSPIIEKANVLIFPTLEAGNIGYKLVQQFSRTKIAGPILWGLKKPVSDLSRGCTPQEIVETARCLVDMVTDKI